MVGAAWARRGLMAACVVAALARPALAAAATFTNLVVFGDSLSDVGNNGRYSAGFLWDEHLAGAYGLTLTASNAGGTDYAISGALITQGGPVSLPGQVAAYLGAHPGADPKALYAIWGGGNDVFSTISNPSSGAQVAATGIADTLAMITALYKAGARNFLIGEVPRTDLTPFVQSLGASVIAQQAALVTLWNQKLRPKLAPANWPGSHVWRYNAASGMVGIFTSPTHFGFTNITSPCGNSCTDPAHTLFWDSIHPGATAHAMIGDAMLGVVTQ